MVFSMAGLPFLSTAVENSTAESHALHRIDRSCGQGHFDVGIALLRSPVKKPKLAGEKFSHAVSTQGRRL
jgi:hypothetical protein